MSKGWRHALLILLGVVLLALMLLPWGFVVILSNILVHQAWNAPQWSVAELTSADLKQYPVSLADTCLVQVSGSGLMQTKGLVPGLHNTHMIVLEWNDGSMHVVLTRGFVMPLDAKGLPQPYQEVMSPAIAVHVSGAFTMIGLVPGIEGMQCGMHVGSPRGLSIDMSRRARLISVRTLSIGKMNQGTWSKTPQVKTPSPSVDPLKDLFEKPCAPSDCKLF
jgi:hypothetical protein